MAMGASLVALATDVDLQRLELPPPQSQAVGSQFGFKTIHFSEGKNSGMTGIVRKGVNYGAGYLFLGRGGTMGQATYSFSRRSLRIYGRGQDNSGGPK